MVGKKVSKIQFNYINQSFYLPQRTKLKGFILELFKDEGVKVEFVNYIFCSDQYLLQINQDFLNHDTFTDIITFQYNNLRAAVQSDIYISVDRVKENALTYNTRVVEELYRVVFHGALHLCGYKDKAKKDIAVMRNKERHYLARYVSRGTK